MLIYYHASFIVFFAYYSIVFFIIVDHSLKKIFKINKTCSLSSFITFYFIIGNLKLNDSCEIAEQCIQPFARCFQGKCKCINGYSAFDTDSCMKGV